MAEGKSDLRMFREERSGLGCQTNQPLEWSPGFCRSPREPADRLCILLRDHRVHYRPYSRVTSQGRSSAGLSAPRGIKLSRATGMGKFGLTITWVWDWHDGRLNNIIRGVYEAWPHDLPRDLGGVTHMCYSMDSEDSDSHSAPLYACTPQQVELKCQRPGYTHVRYHNIHFTVRARTLKGVDPLSSVFVAAQGP